ncbi:MAG: hypothetical protein HY754_08885 [Nitrospirae bacterium]|nr:hypothetical protein [Nitrospirota bacterium]
MSKAKLTLYVDDNIAKLAHRTARLAGKSISIMVKEYFIQKDRETHTNGVSPAVSKWIGILTTKKTYKKLRDEYIDYRLKKYESID